MHDEKLPEPPSLILLGIPSPVRQNQDDSLQAIHIDLRAIMATDLLLLQDICLHQLSFLHHHKDKPSPKSASSVITECCSRHKAALQLHSSLVLEV